METIQLVLILESSSLSSLLSYTHYHTFLVPSSLPTFKVPFPSLAPHKTIPNHPRITTTMPTTKASSNSITAAAAGSSASPAGEPKHLPCPRCESTNTKFCYYNNYNLSQPRHYCKSCRRYWTRGGTLRNIPFGGAHRKNKRPRSSSSATAPPPPPTPQESSEKAEVNVNEAAANELNFTALMGLGEYGIGPDEMIGNGLGLGKMDWPIGEDGGSWQLGSGGAGGGDGCVGFWDGGDCFSWPEIAISSAPGKDLE